MGCPPIRDKQMTAAETQKAYRDADEAAKRVLHVLLQLAHHGKCRAETSGVDTLTVEIDVPDHETLVHADPNLSDALATDFTDWLDLAATSLWADGEPLGFRIKIEAIIDRRKRKARAKGMADLFVDWEKVATEALRKSPPRPVR